MKADSMEFEPVALHSIRRAHPSVRQATPAAIDEVFANLARRQDEIVRTNERRLDVTPFRDTATEMDRQRERLAQLLRDIDA